MEKGFIRRAMAALENGSSDEACRIMNEGLVFLFELYAGDNHGHRYL